MEHGAKVCAWYFAALHPSVCMAYFVAAIGLTLACSHPAAAALSLAGGTAFSILLRGGKETANTYKFVLPMFLLIAIGNPLFNHRGATMLFMLFDQWITLEAICYGLVSACTLSAIIVWFACYQQVMTSDKFLYLFGNIAPNTALLITMTLRFIPKLKKDAADIAAAETMLNGKPQRLTQKLGAVMRRLSVLLTMSMEAAVETADSMRARGWGCGPRGRFSIWRFGRRDAALGAVMAAAGALLAAGVLGGGARAAYYPVLSLPCGGWTAAALAGYGALCFLPAAVTIWEEISWRISRSKI